MPLSPLQGSLQQEWDVAAVAPVVGRQGARPLRLIEQQRLLYDFSIVIFLSRSSSYGCQEEERPRHVRPSEDCWESPGASPLSPGPSLGVHNYTGNILFLLHHRLVLQWTNRMSGKL